MNSPAVMPVSPLAVLILRHPLQFAHVAVAGQDPAQLGVLMHIALQEQGDLFGIQPAGEIQRDQILGVLLELFGVLGHGDGVQVGDEDVHLIFILIFHELTDGTDVIAKSQSSGRLDAAQHCLHVCLPPE